MEASQQAVLAGWRTHQCISNGVDAVAISLQASSLSQKALLVIGDQIDAKRGDELMVGSVEISQCGLGARTQPTLVDLNTDFTGGIPVHQIAEPVEPVLEQRMVGCNAFMNIKGDLDMNQ